MKKIFILFSCLIAINLLAQKPKVKNEPNHDDRPIHFGFSIGLNTMDFRIRQSRAAVDTGIICDVATLQPGFHVHAISNFRLGEYFDFRMLPGISFGGERLISYRDIDNNHPTITQNEPVRIESNFIELPFLIKYKSVRINNFRPYLIGGTNIRFDLAAAKKTWATLGGSLAKDKSYVLLDVFDYYYEIGFGVDFYFEYFKFTTEFKYSVGMRNVLREKNRKGEGPSDDIALFTNVIDRLNSRMFMISFHFE